VNVLSGGEGGDELFGVGGADTLDGGEGGDILHSSTGDGDVLIGGKGEDIMWGHAGRDTFKFAVGDSVANDDGSGADVINGFQVTDRLVFKTGAFAWSYAEKTAATYGEAFGMAQERMATGEAGMNFTAVKVGSDVFVFAGEVTGQSFALQNVVKLAGVGLDAIDYYDFLGG
jgi:Ca2+-binding RTX toxin-like protein